MIKKKLAGPFASWRLSSKDKNEVVDLIGAGFEIVKIEGLDRKERKLGGAQSYLRSYLIIPEEVTEKESPGGTSCRLGDNHMPRPKE